MNDFERLRDEEQAAFERVSRRNERLQPIHSVIGHYEFSMGHDLLAVSRMSVRQCASFLYQQIPTMPNLRCGCLLARSEDSTRPDIYVCVVRREQTILAGTVEDFQGSDLEDEMTTAYEEFIAGRQRRGVT